MPPLGGRSYEARHGGTPTGPPRSLLSAEKAEAKLEIRAEEHEQWMLKRIDECNIRDWHPFFGHGMPLSERRRLIRKAGRPDLIDPATCRRFGITEETWPSDIPFGTRPAT
jgi:hypothetical protein